MSVITFWDDGKKETGKTLSMVAIATYMAIEHNYKILVISTGYKDKALNNCFWKEKKVKKSFGLFGPNTKVEMEDGISGLNKIMKSNKLSPEIITNYTKIVFKERLEIIQAYNGIDSEYEEIAKNYSDIIKIANNYYDLIFVDLDKSLPKEVSEKMIENTDLVVANIDQGIMGVDEFMETREKTPTLSTKKTLILVGKHDKDSKYTAKNITRYLGEKNKILTIPYNTLFFEASEEAAIPDLFLRLRKVDSEDINGYFMGEVKRASENIVYRLQDLQMRM